MNKELLGIASIFIAILSYSFYFHGIFDHKTKPHAFSWFIWGILMSISFYTQISNNAGPGGWVVGFTAVLCFGISLIAFSKGMKNISKLDLLSLTGALLAIFFLFIIKDPIISVILVTISYSLGFFPTFRKSFSRPQDETLITFALNGLKFFISLFALSNFSFITAFYPSILVIINWIFAIMLVVRKKQLRLS